MRIVIATDAWRPQINGLVRTYENTVDSLQRAGHQVSLITPLEFFTVPWPADASMHLALWPGSSVCKYLDSYRPDVVHVATEGPLGHAARAWCLRHDFPFTTSFHSRFAEYVLLRMPVPLNLTYAYLRNFHKHAARTLVPTVSQQDVLLARGFSNVAVWQRGVDTRLFYPRPEKQRNCSRPVFAYAGRIAVEKNIEAFLELDLPGSKLVIGDGPDLRELMMRYPRVQFTGYKDGAELAACIADADVFVYPSVTDTFGITMLEAMACGVPVAAFPVTGPIDVIENGVNGVMDRDLRKAALTALELDAADCVRYARRYSWDECARTFLSYLEPVKRPGRKPVPEIGARLEI